MIEETPPPVDSIRAGYEVRDVSAALVAAVGALLIVMAVILHGLLWALTERVVPEQRASGASPPVVMPGEAPVAARLQAIPPPRLDPLEPLVAEPPSYRSSRPVPGSTSPTQRPEDLRADRQPQLNEYGWVERGKSARIPIGPAMDAVVEAARGKGGRK